MQALFVQYPESGGQSESLTHGYGTPLMGPPPKSTVPLSAPRTSTPFATSAKTLPDTDAPGPPKLLLQTCPPVAPSSRAIARSFVPALVSAPPPKSTVPLNVVESAM